MITLTTMIGKEFERVAFSSVAKERTTRRQAVFAKAFCNRSPVSEDDAAPAEARFSAALSSDSPAVQAIALVSETLRWNR